jgi:hypothetical protein
MNDENKHLSKMAVKRMQIYAERRSRLINKGISEAEVDEVLAREDYERKPLEKKHDMDIQRLERIIAGSHRGLVADIHSLMENQAKIYRAMDVNFTAFEMALAELDVSVEKQREYLKRAEEIVNKKYADARKQEDELQAALAAQAEKKSIVEDAAVAGEPQKPPEDATSFGS